MKDSLATSPTKISIKLVTRKLRSQAIMSRTIAALCSALLTVSTATAATGDTPLYLTAILDSPQNRVIDGPAPAARTGFLKSMASDSLGNLYFSDASSHAIRQLTQNGLVRTLTDEVLFNVDFMAVDTNDQLYFVQLLDPFRSIPRWEMKRLNDDGTTELVASGDGKPFGMQHDLHDGFYIYLNHSRYSDIHHEIIRVSTAGDQETIYDSQSPLTAWQRPIGWINGMTVDNNGTLVVLDNLMLRRVYNNGALEDIASFSPSVGTLGRDIAFTPSGQIVLCTQQQISVWDLTTYQLVYAVGDAPFSMPVDGQPERFNHIRYCQADANGNIHVMHMNGFDHHTLFRIHAGTDPVQFPALHDQSGFGAMLQQFAAGAQFSVDRSGIVHVHIDSFDYQLIADEVMDTDDINNNDAPALITGIHETADLNGDGLNEFLLTFPDRMQQLLYLMKPEDLPLQ